MAKNDEWRRGFEDCAELTEKRLHDAKTLEEAREDLKRVLAMVKEIKIARLEAKLGL